MLNKVILMGRLTKDPELRHTQSNTPVASFRLAVDSRYKRDPNNPQPQDTLFIDVVCWQQTAEFAAKWFRKGQLVAVDGRLQQREWKDRDGNNRSAIEVVASEVHFAEKRSDSPNAGGGNYPPPGASYGGPSQSGSYGNSASAAPRAPSASEPAAISSGFAELDDDDGELPF